MLNLYIFESNNKKLARVVLPKTITNHSNKYKEKKARKLSLQAWKALVMVLSNDYSIRINNKSFTFSKNGKPILNNKKLHVSLSHSNSMIAIAVSDYDVGVDIEKVVNKTMAKTLSKALHVKNDCLEVTSKWIKMESYIKLKDYNLCKLLNENLTNKTFNTKKVYVSLKNVYYVSVINSKQEKIKETYANYSKSNNK